MICIHLNKGDTVIYRPYKHYTGGWVPSIVNDDCIISSELIKRKKIVLTERKLTKKVE
jgi:hypothetical protein